MHLFKAFHFICKCCSFIVAFKHAHPAITLMTQLIQYEMQNWVLRACSHALLQWMWWCSGRVYSVVLEVTCWMCSCCSQATLPQQCRWANGSGHHCAAPIHDHGEWVGWGWGWMWVWVWVGVWVWVWAMGGMGVRMNVSVGASMSVGNGWGWGCKRMRVWAWRWMWVCVDRCQL